MKTSILFAAITTIALSIGNAQPFLNNGLLAYYPFNGNANDAVGTNNGTVIGATLANDRFGNPGHAYAFNGTTYIQCPDTGLPSGTNARTVSLWVQIASFGFGGSQLTYPFGYGANAASSAFYLEVSGAPYVKVGQVGGGGGPEWDGPTTNRWYHAAVTFSNGTANLYINGTNRVQASRAYSTTLTGHFFIGGNFQASLGPPTFVGAISDVRIYNRALSPQDVAQLYTVESGPLVTLAKAVKPSFSNLTLGTNYQLQVSADLSIWTNQGSPFTATNSAMVYPQYWDVDNWGRLFFRLKVFP